jgi:D-alanine-D-alanine ligase-like ATP-grasp enzyme
MGESNGSTSLRVALISEQRSNYLQLGYSEEDCAALTHDGEIQAVLSTLKNLGHQVTLVPGIESLVQQLAAGKHKCWDLAFNMAQGFHGPARESQVPALLGAYQVPHTFADAATMALCQNKANTKVDTPGSLPGDCLGRSRLTNFLQP